jgi:hypothetical protein
MTVVELEPVRHFDSADVSDQDATERDWNQSAELLGSDLARAAFLESAHKLILSLHPSSQGPNGKENEAAEAVGALVHHIGSLPDAPTEWQMEHGICLWIRISLPRRWNAFLAGGSGESAPETTAREARPWGQAVFAVRMIELSSPTALTAANGGLFSAG